MIDVITKIFCALLCGYIVTYSSIKIGKLNNNGILKILSSILMGTIIYLTYFVNYNSEALILKIVVFILILKLIYKIATYRAVILILINMLMVAVCEIISSIVVVNFINAVEARSKWYFVLLFNSLIFIFMILIVSIPFVNKKMNEILDKTENKKRVSTLVLLVLSVLMIVYLLYNLSINYEWNEKYLITIFIMISYIIISLIFFKDKLEYNMLEEKYDALFDYFSEIAENIDDLNLTTHEYKNQIAIVSNYIENKKYKKAKEYINDIAISINKDEGLLVNLSGIPTGGLKGLLYYKIIVAKNQKVEIVLDVGNNIKKVLNKLSESEIKIITRIIGVYIDNAVTEAKKKNKIVNIEVYNFNDKLYFAISNRINKNININDIGKKGFTTKGKGHGKGIYLTNKLISKNKWLKNETNIVNNYYVTKLIVDTKNIGV